jgi:hypothetical protein
MRESAKAMKESNFAKKTGVPRAGRVAQGTVRQAVYGNPGLFRVVKGSKLPPND